MKNDLHSKYTQLSKEALFQVILSPFDYTSEAVDTAKQIASEKKWDIELNQLLEAQQKETEQKEIEEEIEIEEKAEYYKELLDFKKQRNSFEVRIADVPKFEGVLVENDIQFFREDKNIGAQIDIYPTQTYYFRNEDVEQVDKIVKELTLITSPYIDYKPFFKMEMIVIIIVVIAVLVVLAIFTT